MTYTYTFVTLDISKAAYDEIHQKLEAAQYQHTFTKDGQRDVIDMHGIALAIEDVEDTKADDFSG